MVKQSKKPSKKKVNPMSTNAMKQMMKQPMPMMSGKTNSMPMMGNAVNKNAGILIGLLGKQSSKPKKKMNKK